MLNTGIEPVAREAIADGLVQVLAETYALYQTTHLYHWNVRGPQFNTLHTLFGTQYAALWAALDEIAERIRALDVLAPSHATLAERVTLKPDNDPSPTATAMLKALLAGQEAVVRAARACLRVAADAGDEATADLMTARCAAGEKDAWMLRALLSE
jgi:starvation-inducible DNA-binding protein